MLPWQPRLPFLCLVPQAGECSSIAQAPAAPWSSAPPRLEWGKLLKQPLFSSHQGHGHLSQWADAVFTEGYMLLIWYNPWKLNEITPFMLLFVPSLGWIKCLKEPLVSCFSLQPFLTSLGHLSCSYSTIMSIISWSAIRGTEVHLLKVHATLSALLVH